MASLLAHNREIPGSKEAQGDKRREKEAGTSGSDSAQFLNKNPLIPWLTITLVPNDRNHGNCAAIYLHLSNQTSTTITKLARTQPSFAHLEPILQVISVTIYIYIGAIRNGIRSDIRSSSGESGEW